MELHAVDSHLLVVDAGHDLVGGVRAHLQLGAHPVDAVAVRQQDHLLLRQATANETRKFTFRIFEDTTVRSF